eukprot:scaffold96157_cov57-Phaeocystis_antarctica.AAC.2
MVFRLNRTQPQIGSSLHISGKDVQRVIDILQTHRRPKSAQAERAKRPKCAQSVARSGHAVTGGVRNKQAVPHTSGWNAFLN